MTYSIVARDAETGQLGVAIQTCYFAVGAIAPWARAGVGAVATQAHAEPAYGPRCLDLLAAGRRAEEALAEVRRADEQRELRQVGVVDAAGATGTFTGSKCVDYAGHHVGDGYSVQANMMASDRVWPAMAETYEATRGPFATRLLAALGAGEAAGGDARGRMSAAMIIVEPESQAWPWEGRLVDIRVDHADAPLEDLGHLLRTATAYHRSDVGEVALFRGEIDVALAEAAAALAELPDDGNLRLLRIGALLLGGRTDEGVAEVRDLVRARPDWAIVLRSFADKDLFPLPSVPELDELLGR